MFEITEAHWTLWYGLVYVVAIAGAWTVTTVLLILLRLARPPKRPTTTGRPAANHQQPDLENDPQLHRFFAKVNHAYRRYPPAHAYAPPAASTPLTPHVVRMRADPEMVSAAPPLPAPASTMPDPEVLHSAPFYSPRTDKSRATTRPLSLPVAPRSSTPAPAPAEPATTDKDLVTLINLWAQLSAKDRRELLGLARIKSGQDQ